jgi:hypothetical protein
MTPLQRKPKPIENSRKGANSASTRTGVAIGLGARRSAQRGDQPEDEEGQGEVAQDEADGILHGIRPVPVLRSIPDVGRRQRLRGRTAS